MNNMASWKSRKWALLQLEQPRGRDLGLLSNAEGTSSQRPYLAEFTSSRVNARKAGAHFPDLSEQTKSPRIAAREGRPAFAATQSREAAIVRWKTNERLSFFLLSFFKGTVTILTGIANDFGGEVQKRKDHCSYRVIGSGSIERTSL